MSSSRHDTRPYVSCSMFEARPGQSREDLPFVQLGSESLHVQYLVLSLVPERCSGTCNSSHSKINRMTCRSSGKDESLAGSSGSQLICARLRTMPVWRLGALGVILLHGAECLHSLLPSLGKGLNCGYVTRSSLCSPHRRGALIKAISPPDVRSTANLPRYKTRAVAPARQNVLSPRRIRLDFAHIFCIIATCTPQFSNIHAPAKLGIACVKYHSRPPYLITFIPPQHLPNQATVLEQQA